MRIKSVEVDFTAGDSITEVANQATEFCEKNQCKLHTNFNGVDLYICPGMSMMTVVDVYMYLSANRFSSIV
jgi:hypothetical protein